jgi:hypothetical protein
MSDEERRAEEQAERARPRIVDKRVSSRRTSGGQPVPGDATGASQAAVADEPGVPEPTATVPPPAGPAPEPADTVPPRAGPAPAPPQTTPSDPLTGQPGEPERIWTPEEEAEAQRIAQEISARPSLEWVVNVAVTLANVAGTKLDMGDAADARLAIDALAGIVNGAGASLGDAENPLRQTLAQLQLAYAQAMAPPTP